MQNKYGLDYEKLLFVERKIVNTKLNLLDEQFIFGEDVFGLEYIKQIHNFLFSDLYHEEQLNLRKLSQEEYKYIKFLLNSIKEICINQDNCIDMLIENLIKIWKLQIFKDGNTRTLVGYLSILNNAFLLNLDIDLNKEIKSRPNTLCKTVFVNQKQLTKTK